MRELSLFSGVGGGLLASMLLGHTIVGAVEIDSYCCSVLEQRQKDGVFDYFPIFQTDIRDFIRAGYADLYKGHCELVSGGFPCQPFSHAGKRKGAADNRNMWPSTIEVVRRITPEFCFFENVPGLLNSGYFGQVVADLAEAGYGVRWRILSAAELGAPHKRDRLWIVAHTDRSGQQGDYSISGRLGETSEISQLDRQGSHSSSGIDGTDMAGRKQHSSVDQQMADANSGRRQQREQEIGQFPESKSSVLSGDGWWDAQPPLRRMDDGYAGRTLELKAAGNAQVPVCAAAAFLLLVEDFL